MAPLVIGSSGDWVIGSFFHLLAGLRVLENHCGKPAGGTESEN